MYVRTAMMNVGGILLVRGVGGIWLLFGRIEFKQWAVLFLKQCAMQFKYNSSERHWYQN